MWGFEYKMFTTVGVVRNIEHSSTKITYSLQDKTGKITVMIYSETQSQLLNNFSGQINAHLWVEEGDSPSSSAIMLNTYARVIGAVRQQGDVKSIMIYKIHPVKSINEVSTHYMEVVNARYQAEEYHKGGTGSSTVKSSQGKSEAPAAFGTQSTQGGPQGKDVVVFKAIQQSGETSPERGISRKELYAKFPNFSVGELDKIIDKMSGEGHIYSTLDNDHFMACF